MSPPLSQQSANKALILPPAQSLQAGGRAQPALILCYGQGFPSGWHFCSTAHAPAFTPPRFLTPSPHRARDKLLATPGLLRAGRNRSVFSPQSHRQDQRPRDAERSQAQAAILRHRNVALPFQMRSSLGVCVSSRRWAVQQL